MATNTCELTFVRPGSRHQSVSYLVTRPPSPLCITLSMLKPQQVVTHVVFPFAVADAVPVVAAIVPNLFEIFVSMSLNECYVCCP